MSDVIQIRYAGEAIDEIVAKNADVHIERLSDSGIWIGIKTATEYLHVRLWTKRQRIEIGATKEAK